MDTALASRPVMVMIALALYSYGLSILYSMLMCTLDRFDDKEKHRLRGPDESGLIVVVKVVGSSLLLLPLVRQIQEYVPLLIGWLTSKPE